jgi:hypothetical protein
MLMPITLSSLVGLSAVPPVKIATCDFPITASYGDGDSVTNGAYSVRIRFVNVANQAISRVRFSLDDGTSVVDAGTFSPSVTIDHILLLPKSTDATSCSVSSVTFADGESWNGG